MSATERETALMKLLSRGFELMPSDTPDRQWWLANVVHETERLGRVDAKPLRVPSAEEVAFGEEIEAMAESDA